MIVLLDTDVLIDVALDRTPHAEPAAQLLDALQRGLGAGFVAWHTASNFYYLVAASRGGASAREFVLELLRFVEVASTKTAGLRRAAGLALKDFEDAMQVVAAEACGADVIATRNVRDYVKSPVRAATPKSVLAELV